MSDSVLAKRWPWLTAAGLVVIAALSTLVDFRWGDPRPSGSAQDVERLAERNDLNLLFILIDTLRSDRLGSYGYERDTSPVMDRLAGKGVRFARQLSQSSWTKASMASLWTGLNPNRTGVTRFNHLLPDEGVTTPAEILRDAGFRTAGIYRNGWVSPYFGFDQGFEVYNRPMPLPSGADVVRKNPTVKGGGTDESLIATAAEFLRVHGKERWFLYLHLMDIHEYVYDAQSALFGSSYSDVYDNSIRWTDGTLELLLGHLANEGYLENTVIVIASDHGEAFGERGLEGHARFLYKESTEVPLIIAFPFTLDPGAVVDVRTSNVDIWPTLLDLLGLPALPETDGRSRVPEILATIRGETVPGEETPAFAHLDRHWGQREQEPMATFAVAEGTYRYVRVPAKNGPTTEELFDAAGDAGELDSVLDANPEVAARLRARVDGYIENSQTPWEEPPVELEVDEMQLNQLRALGYSLP
ncbi:MAG: sulfatase [Myxococcota bacterium]|nr:sulfatase [Myxococcota bacterium]